MKLSRPFLLVMLGFAVLAALPLILSGNLLNAAIKMMIAALFALAFTLAMGQAGMLSFGHAAYYGLGAFAALHVMKAVESEILWVPTPLIPFAGAFVGFVFGLIFGWFATQRSGVYFAMVTLALAELLFTLSPTLNTIFGGESGISTIRPPWWIFNFGPDVHVYYLTLAWVAFSTFCMWAFTRTPLGRLALALRENEHRVRFLGFNTHVARTLIFAISCLFTGVAGALLAIANEATNYTIFAAQASANVVLQTFIGGAGTFFGPALGAAVMTFFARVTSDLTRSWLLYQGLIFVIIMLFAPTGLGGLVANHAQKVRAGQWRQLIGPYALCALAGVLLILGLVFTVESIHHVLTDSYLAARRAAGGAWVPYKMFGATFIPNSPLTWAVPILLLGAGGLLLAFARGITLSAWRRATTEVEAVTSPAMSDAQARSNQGAAP